MVQRVVDEMMQRYSPHTPPEIYVWEDQRGEIRTFVPMRQQTKTWALERYGQ